MVTSMLVALKYMSYSVLQAHGGGVQYNLASVGSARYSGFSV